MDMKLEAIILPVSDVDRAKAFYERAGFAVDVDHATGPDFRVVQLTPPGSACSIIIGVGIGDGMPGSYTGMHLVVADLPAALAELEERGVETGEPLHFGAEGRTPGVDRERRDYATFAELRDPDGNLWLLQEVGHRRA
jgi:catechol 2,3-dioxygenase-like lactoylglutathione lyase family enzyme